MILLSSGLFRVGGGWLLARPALLAAIICVPDTAGVAKNKDNMQRATCTRAAELLSYVCLLPHLLSAPLTFRLSPGVPNTSVLQAKPLLPKL